MAKLDLTLLMRNDAFVQDRPGEVARILHKLADKITSGVGVDLEPGDDGILLDLNGAHVGQWAVTEDELDRLDD